MTRARILKRDGYACQIAKPGRPGGKCGAKANQCDHIVPAYLGGDDSDANLRAACWNCHKVLSSSQGGQASATLRRQIAAKRTRPVQPHPGLRDPAKQEAS
jgi:5-methylcytosine-specific restriction endonuclease McrA